MTSPRWISSGYVMEEEQDDPTEPDYLFCYLPPLPPLIEPVYPQGLFHYPRYRLESPLALCRTRNGSLYFLPVIDEVDETDSVELVNHVRIEELPPGGVTQNREERYVVEEPAEEDGKHEKEEKLASSDAGHSAAICELKKEAAETSPKGKENN